MSTSSASHRGSWFLAALALASLAPAASGQTFSKVTDPANPIVVDLPVILGGFPGSSWIDADGDGLADLFIGNQGLYRNLGGGAFTRINIPNNVFNFGHSWGDYDNDGDADLMVAGSTRDGRGSRLWRNDGDGVFTQITTGVIGDSLANVGWSCAWGDYDADGHLDLVIAQAVGFTGGGPNTLLHNQGDGTFVRELGTDVTASMAPHTIPTWSDFDLDGDLDLSIGSGPVNGSLGPDYFYRNLTVEGGTPVLDRITTGALATDLRDGQVVQWIDYDNDADIDCFITNYLNQSNSLYRNDAGTYVRMTSVQAGPIVAEFGLNLGSQWADLDNDGDLDCLVNRTGPHANRYYRNDGGGRFSAVELGELTASGSPTVVAADYDRDGWLDLFKGGAPATRGLFRNVTGNGNHWLEVRLIGWASNRSAIGARIHAVATIGGQSVSQTREVSAQNAFNGHSEFTLHVGLGDATEVEDLRIVWPSGRVQRLGRVSADQVLTVQEPDPATPTLAALTEWAVTARGVELAWQGEGVNGAIVERRAEREAWNVLGAARSDGRDRVVFVDDEAAPGDWAYRLRLTNGATTAEQWVEVPAAEMALRALGTAGNGHKIAVELALPAPAPVRIDVIDAGGRRVATHALGTLDAGRRRLELDAPRAPGLYWLRLEAAGRRLTTRTVVVR